MVVTAHYSWWHAIHVWADEGVASWPDHRETLRCALAATRDRVAEASPTDREYPNAPRPHRPETGRSPSRAPSPACPSAPYPGMIPSAYPSSDIGPRRCHLRQRHPRERSGYPEMPDAAPRSSPERRLDRPPVRDPEYDLCNRAQ